MLVAVMNSDNTITNYVFDPQHKSEVIGFYTKEYWQGLISGFKATMDNGEIVAIGATI